MEPSAPAPAPTSTPHDEKPLLHYLSIDVLLKIINHTFLNPFFTILIPLAFRAQGFQYHHAPLWGSALYTAVITLLYVLQHVNESIACGPKREFDWTEEVVVITGGASGLGLLIAEVYGMRGVSIAVLDVKETPEGGELEAENVMFYKCDVGDRAQVRRVAGEIEKELGTPTVLINNAAIVHGKSILDLTCEEIESTFQTNLLSHFWTIKQFLPGMLKLGRGTIVTVSSVTGQIGPKMLADYSASKAALTALHSSLTAELGGVNSPIKTILVSPGQMSNNLFAGVETPSTFLAPVLEPVDVAKEIIAAIDAGTGGTLAMPAYSRWFAVYGVLPAGLQRWARWVSGCDEAMSGFKGWKGIERTESGEKS